MNLLVSLFFILVVVFVFNFIIFIHELGHFLAAKWRRMQVDRFQIWFGKPIWKKTIGGVQYGLGTIPFGGFVSLPEMAPMDAIEGKAVSTTAEWKKVTPLDKIIVAFAGPLFSLLLALAAACVVWKVGKIELPVTSTQIGYILPDSPAEKAGLKVGDTIIEIAGEQPTSFNGSFNAVTTMIALSEGEQIPLKVRRAGEEKSLKVGYEIPETAWYERRAMRQIGIAPVSKIFVGTVMAHSPAEKAGLQKDDQIIAVNGTPVKSYGTIIEQTKNSENSVNYTIQRGKDTLEFIIQPEYPDIVENKERVKMIGIGFKYDSGAEPILTHPTPLAQIKEAANIMLVSFKKVISTASSLDVQHFSGPIGIGGSMYDTLKLEDGWKHLLWIMVIFNVNLAIFNLMPFPVLDGGHIVLSFLEMITGKQPKLKLLEYVQAAFVLLLFSLFIFVTLKDIGDRFGPKPAEVKVEFLPDH